MSSLPAQSTNRETAVEARRWILTGVVQGVGFRPFVYRLAQRHTLAGWVKNCLGQVEVVACGSAGQLNAFGADLLARAPAIARPEISVCEPTATFSASGFSIRPSDTGDGSDIHLPVDYFVCADCLKEMHDPSDRRYHYPFINCTQCGPRYTLIRSLPYDRPNTSMADFPLCEACQKEYRDPSNRRFHAEPVACPACGPQLRFIRGDKPAADTAQALSACCEALRDGLVVAVKGVGGFHLMCDAANHQAVQWLRERKPRPHKPLAVMFPETTDLQLLRSDTSFSDVDEKLLRSPTRPIVLLKKRSRLSVTAGTAPGLDEIGVMLPYSPLHHLLLAQFGGALVATSANISGEPVFTDETDVIARLGHVAQACLSHDRPIVRPADDPLYRTIAGHPRPLRMGRGNAPTELDLPRPLDRPVLAVGGQMKNTLCLAWGNRAVVSPHIGDMGTPRSLRVFAQVVQDLQDIYAVRAELILCDMHPDYATSRWAARSRLPVFKVQHHAAHASALVGEHKDPYASGDCLVFTWDGVGMGSDATLWGGEALLGRPGHWTRVASMRQLRIPGADRAGREPWRSGVAMALDCGATQVARELIARAQPSDTGGDAYALVSQAWAKALNTPLTSAVGRLFDAAAALTGVCLNASFEGQGPMQLEALAHLSVDPLEMQLETDGDGMLRSDWRPLLAVMADAGLAVEHRASVFHDSLAQALVQQACAIRRQHAVDSVGLCGGVFQNRRLTEACIQRLRAEGFQVLLGRQLPVNDAAISFGQVIQYLAQQDAGVQEN